MKIEFKFFQTNPIKAEIILLFFSLDEWFSRELSG